MSDRAAGPPSDEPSSMDPAEPSTSDVQLPAADEHSIPEPPSEDRALVPRVIGSTEARAIGTFDDSGPLSGSGISSFGGGTGRSGGSGKARLGDRIFAALTAGSGLFIVILIALVAVFLVARAAPAIMDDKSNFLLSRDWNVDGPTLHFGILGLLWVTVLISVVAMILAVPIAVGIALFITHYAPRRIARPVAYTVDLLAAIPSIVYGIWGIIILAPKLEPVQRVLYHLGFIPFLKNQNIASGTIFNGGVVLAVMILPIITAISRDVFERTPRENIEGAWALGATKWEMIRLAVLPFGRPGLISGAMLGLGRALGETIAIMLILSKPGDGSPFSASIFANGETFASKIANNAQEFNDPRQTGAFIAAGLVLFVLTFAVNAAARSVVNRRKEFS
jgi:phosphate transport system permease protein